MEEIVPGGADLGDSDKNRRIARTFDIKDVIIGIQATTHKKGLEYFFWGRSDIASFDDRHVHSQVRGS
ncbi:MAG: hypothetical protein LBO70_03905, partial [Clostridiales Family XIII bacterium]|nr:hypothetical protein [Clostridiales Family XIII bacterium]